MKIAFIIILAACLQVSARGVAQQITIVGKNMTMREVFDKIEDKTGFGILIDHGLLATLHKVDLDEKNATLDQVLHKSFVGQPTALDYTITGHTISIFKKTPENIPVANPGIPLTIELIGKVTDSTGSPLVGAIVIVDGTKYGASTDENGEFRLKAINSDATLTISFVGYVTRKVSVNGRNSITLHLMMANKELAGVTVGYNSGYQHIAKDRATGSFAYVDNQLLNRRVSTNVLDKMEGLVPGLLVNHNTNISGNTQGIDISIRGYSTLFANAQPLIVVDNFPYDGNIQNINPNDVESITVLKDAAAASIWGVQSGNGVIVITTKKGYLNQPLSLEANANVTIGQKPNLFYNPNFLDSKDFIGVEQSLYSQGYYDGLIGGFGEPPISPVVQDLAAVTAGTMTSSQANADIANWQNIDVRKDLTKYFYQKPISQQYALNLRGGDAKHDYIFSGGYDNNRANLVGNWDNRVTIKAVNNFHFFDHLHLSIEADYTQSSIQSNSSVGNITTGGSFNTIYPYAQLVGSDNTALPVVKDYNYSWITDPTAQAGLLNWQYRPYAELKYANNKSNLRDNRIVAGIRYDIIKGLSAEVRYQYEKSSTYSADYYSDSTYYTRNLINEYTNPTTLVGAIPQGGILNAGNSNLTSNRLRGQINYSNNLSLKNAINAIVGAEVSESVAETITPASTYGYDNNTGSFQNANFTSFFTLNPTYSRALIPNGEYFGKLTNRYVSYFSTAAYTFDSKYTLSASGRIDKSNLFGVNTNQKKVPLWSTGLAWSLDKERFYRVSWLPILKVKATYGYNGNINKSATAVTTVLQQSGSYFFGIPFDIIANPGNPELRWEKDKMINFGLDFGIKGNILSGSLEYYLKQGINLFGNAPNSPATGVSTFFGNTADTRGHGIDLQLNASIFNRSTFKWTSNFILSYGIDKVTKYGVPFTASSALSQNADPGGGYGLSPKPGKPIFSLYSYRSAGLTHATGDPQGYLYGKVSTDYTSILNNVQSIDSLRYNGSARPIVFGSFRNTFSYGALSLSFNILYELHYSFRRTSINYASLYQTWSGANRDFTNRWMSPGDESRTGVPSMPTVANLNTAREAFYKFSDGLIEKGDNVRLQDVQLNYELSKIKLFKGKISHLNLYAYANNLGIIWRANRHKLDPDIFDTGTYSAFPAQKTYAIGIKTNL